MDICVATLAAALDGDVALALRARTYTEIPAAVMAGIAGHHEAEATSRQLAELMLHRIGDHIRLVERPMMEAAE